MLADFSLGDLLISMIMFFFLVMFLMLMFQIIGDIIQSTDISGGAKAGWALLIILLPALGCLIYLAARGSGMAERSLESAKKSRKLMEDAASVVAPGGHADEIAKLAALRDAGTLTEEEFASMKAKLLS